MPIFRPFYRYFLVLIEQLADGQMSAFEHTGEAAIDIDIKITAGHIGYSAEVMALQKVPGHHLFTMDILGAQFNGIRSEAKCRPDPSAQAIPGFEDGDLAARLMEMPSGGETRSASPNHNHL
jgi:hypothetical protein